LKGAYKLLTWPGSGRPCLGRAPVTPPRRWADGAAGRSAERVATVV